MAAIAASNPLFPDFSPARSMACSTGVASQHSVDNRNLRFDANRADFLCYGCRNVVKMRCIASQESSEAENSIVFLRHRHLLGHRRNFEGTWHPGYGDVFGVAPWRSIASNAPDSNRSLMKELNRLRTMQTGCRPHPAFLAQFWPSRLSLRLYARPTRRYLRLPFGSKGSILQE